MNGRFMIKRKIGSGGLSEVYLAYDFELKKDVALKCSDKKGLLMREFTLMSGMNYPGIPSVYDCIHSSKEEMMCMEYIEGNTLEKLIYNSEFTFESIVGYIIRICGIIEYLHEKTGVLYLDLKPDNVIVNDIGVWLVDYGSCERITEFHEGEINTIYGTRQYAAPEQLERKGVIDCRTDVYQIGCLVSHVVNVRNNKNRRIRKVITRCMDKQSYKRYASAEEVAVILADCTGYTGEIIRK